MKTQISNKLKNGVKFRFVSILLASLLLVILTSLFAAMKVTAIKPYFFCSGIYIGAMVLIDVIYRILNKK